MFIRSLTNGPAAGGIHCVALLLCAGALAAQNVPSYVFTANGTPQPGGGFTGSVTVMVPSSPFLSVAGAPFTAEGTRTVVRTQEDGSSSRLAAPEHRIFRDSAGRTRLERHLLIDPGAPESPEIIEISDPVAGLYIALDPVNKIAHRVRLPKSRVQAAATGAAVIPPPPIEPPDDGFGGRPGISRSIILPGEPPAGPAPTAANASLGIDKVNGVEAEGQRVTVTLPEGMVGNDRPIDRTTETWVSRTLRLTVREKVRDEINGESTSELSGFVLEEPDPALFEVPAGFRVVDESNVFVIRYE